MPAPTVIHRVQDSVFAALLAGVGLAEIWVPLPSVAGEGSRVLSSVVVVVLCATLAFRRRWPLATAAVVLLTWPAVYAVTPILVLFWGQFVPMVVALYTVARHGAGRRDLYGGAIGAATLLFFDLFVGALQEPGEVIFHWLVFVVAWSAGRGLRASESRAREAGARAAEAERRSREEALVAVAGERARIAREMHDVVAHAVSVMVVQAGAAEQVVDDYPERARSALSTIRTTGVGALAEMRRVVALLREDEPGGYRPQPGLAELATLVAGAERDGLAAVLTVEGAERDLPAGLDLSAYRIVQEALTNVRRHADASRVDVAVRYGAEHLEVEVRDDGRGTSAEPNGGHGVIGMRERAAMYGGKVEAGPVDGRGFVVRAVLPLAAT